MRKILASVLALTLLLTGFSMMSFAASTDIYFGDGSAEIVADSDEITVNLYLNPTQEMTEYWISGLSINFAVTGATINESTLAATSITNLTNKSSDVCIMYDTAGESYEANEGAIVIGAMKLTRTDNATTSVITLSNDMIMDYDGASYKDNYSGYTVQDSVTIKWPGSEPEENVATPVANELALKVDGVDHNFTDVPVFEATTSDTSFKLAAYYNGLETPNYLKFGEGEEKSTTISLSNFKKEGEGSFTFQVAIIGKPEATVINKLVVEPIQ